MEKHPKRGSFNAVFAGAAAGILLAGAGLVGLAGNPRWARPVRQAASALPVRSVIGLDSADVQFWPWEALAQARAADSPELITPPPGPGGAFSPEFVNALLEMGCLDVDLDLLNGACSVLNSGEESCFYLEGLSFFSYPVRREADPTLSLATLPLRAGLAMGYRRERLALTLNVEAAEGYAALPENWAAAAQQRALEELMYLVNLSNDDQRAHLYDHMASIFSRAGDLPPTPIFDSQQQLLWRMVGKDQLIQRLERLAALLRYAQQCSVDSYSRYGFDHSVSINSGLYPHQLLYADTLPPQEALLTVLTQAGLDVQLLPLDHQLLILFSWESGNLGVCYDPLLDHFEGFALQ